MRISGTTGILNAHMRSITPMAGGALANTSPFHNLGSGTGPPARSARPRNDPQAGPEIVPHDAFHNGRTEPAPVRQPPGPGAPYRVPPGRAGARPRAARKKRPAGWSPFAGIARIRSLGSPFSLSAVPASQPSRRDSGYPAVGAVQLPRSPRRQCSSCAAPMTGAQGRKPRHARANVMVLAQVKAAWDQWAACPGSLPWQATAMLTARYPPQPYEAADMACVHLTPAETTPTGSVRERSFTTLYCGCARCACSRERGPRAECQCPVLWSAEPCSSRSQAQVL